MSKVTTEIATEIIPDVKNSTDDQSHTLNIAIGLIAGIIVWIAAWQLAIIVIDKYDTRTRLIVYFLMLAIGVGVLFWLNYNDPSSLNPRN